MHNGEHETHGRPLCRRIRTSRGTCSAASRDLGTPVLGLGNGARFPVSSSASFGFHHPYVGGLQRRETARNWGYFVATLAFIVTTFTAMPVISAGLRLAKANWRRPLTRVTENMAITGLLVVLMLIPALVALPSIEGRPQYLVRVFRWAHPASGMSSATARWRSSVSFCCGAVALPDLAAGAGSPSGIPASARHKVALTGMGRRSPSVACALPGLSSRRGDVPAHVPARADAHDLGLPPRPDTGVEGRHHPRDSGWSTVFRVRWA